MLNITKTAPLILMLLAFTQPAWATEDLLTSNLVAQARQWQSKDRDDIAAELWRSVLRSDPTHGEALVKLGLIEAMTGDRGVAIALLEKANRINPKPRGLAELNAALSIDTDKRGNPAQSSVKSPSSKPPVQPKERKPKATSTKTPSSAPAPDALLLKP
jgi:hypothetical protein